MKKVAQLVGIFCIIFLTGCALKTVNGNGNIQSTTKALASFDVVKVSGEFAVNVNAGKSHQATLTIDQNLMHYIQLFVKHKTLYISTKPGVSLKATKVPTVDVMMKKIHALTASGETHITVNNIHSHEFTLYLSGQSHCQLSGRTKNLSINSSGEGTVMAKALSARDVAIDAKGESNVTVNVIRRLKILASGESKIHYYGSPTQLSQSVTGESSIKQFSK